MKSLLTIVLILISSSCFSEEFFGTYLQEPWTDFSVIKDQNKKQRFIERFEAMRYTVKIDKTSVKISIPSEPVYDLSYTIHGNTIVATDNDKIYWLFYIKDKNVLHSTLMSFKRVSN